VISLGHRQRGVTLVMVLVMLVLLTLLAVTTFNLSSSSMQIVGNFQHRSEALAAAQEIIERALSTTRLITNPATIFLAPCSAGNNNCVDVDVNGDGTNDIVVQLTPQPTCVKAQIVPNSQLVFSNPEDLACSVGPSQGTFGIGGVPTGNSLCTDSIWEVRAESSDVTTQAKIAVTEGAAVRVPNTTVATYCP
jgi:Tfp pilus assembly protein PilX